MPAKITARFALSGLAGAAALFALGGCSGNSTSDMTAAKSLLSPAGQTSPAAEATPTADPAATSASAAVKPVTTVAAPIAAPAPLSGEQKIVSFKKRTAVLYSSARGSDGERIEGSTFSFPITGRPAEGASDRIEIATVKGPRWIARSEINIEGASPASQVTAAARPN